jgi:uncharacterized membrane protein
MVSLREQEIEWIRERIREKGITDPDLLDSLTDHICCLAEQHLTATDTLFQYVEIEINKMHPIALKEIQVEKEIITEQLKNKSMKKIIQTSIILSTSFLTLGVIFKIFHLPGAAASLVMGAGIGTIAMLSYIFIILKSQKLILTSLMILFAVAFCLGCLFKVLHWPYATFLMIAGVSGVSFIYCPIHYFSQRKNVAQPLQHAVHHFLIFFIGSMIFLLFDLQSL